MGDVGGCYLVVLKYFETIKDYMTFEISMDSCYKGESFCITTGHVTKFLPSRMKIM
jgi:hypothetical protein